MQALSQAFTPYTLRRLTVKNRLIRTAANSFLGHEDGSLSDRDFEIYQALLDGGVGAVITGHAFVEPRYGRASDRQASLADDRVIPQYRKLAEMAKDYDVRMIAQLSHTGGRSTALRELIAPCDMELRPGKPARAMTVEEIRGVVDAFARAALRAREAGMDGVELHAAHLYLLSQFTTACVNHRTDAYGGSAENRFRILREVMEAIRALCGPDFPVLVKLNANAPEDDDAYWEDLSYMVRELDALGAEAVELSGHDFLERRHGEHLYYLERTAALASMVGVPMIAVGGITTPEDVAAVLERGVPLVGLCRALITQPDFLTRLRRGEGSRCVHCNQCFTVPYTKGKACVFHEDRDA